MGLFAFVIFYLPLKKLIARYGKQNYEASLDMFRHLTQGLNAVKEVKLSCSEKYFAEQINKAQIRRNHAQKCVSDIGQIPRFAMECFAVTVAMGILIVLLTTGLVFSKILLTAAFFVAAMSRLLPSFSRIQYNLLHIRSAMYIFDKIHHDLTQIPLESVKNGNISEKEEQEPLLFEKSITVDHVSYTYPTAKQPVLQDVSFEIKHNECIAFVGKTGCGKSTLADVIMGFLMPDSGAVLVDGQNIADHLLSWRKKIGYVPQAIHLFDDTIQGNVAFGIPVEQIDVRRVEQVIQLAQLKDLVQSLPEGLNTRIGEAGIRLSGGQRQRIAIARALYHNPELLVLDEATSALDQETERDFIEALQALKGKFTIIMIAHRLSSIQYCDRVIQLSQES